MLIEKLGLNCSKPLSFALLVAGVCLLSNTSVNARAMTANPDNIKGLVVNRYNPIRYPIEITQNFSLCSDSEGDYVPRVWAETKDFLVNICYYVEGGSGTYYGRAKNGGASISLPLQSERNERYVAVNGDTRYILTRNQLTVTQGRKTILQQRVLRFYVE
jgi:hypothetical protein